MKDQRDRNPSTLEERLQRRAEIRNVIAMSIPVVVAMTSRAVMDIVDFMMITALELPEAQAAILPAQIVMWSFIIFGMGVVMMVNTFASQCMGRGDYVAAGSYAWQGLYIAAGFGLIGLALRPMLPSVVGMIGHAAHVQALEIAYTQVALFTVAPTIAAYGLGWFFVGIHRPRVTMWSAIEANVVNIVVSYVLIFGHLGFEPLGIAGAAWGTLAAVSYRTVRLAVVLVSPSINARFASRSTWRPSWRRLGDLARVGTPFGLQTFCEVVVWAIFVNVLVGRTFGTIHLIATNTAWQYMRIAFLPAMGVGQALTALVGRSIGAGDPDRAVREVRYAVMTTLAYMGALSLLYALKARDLIGLFSNEPEVMAIGATIMLCAAVFQLFDAIGITYSAALRGAGDTFVPSLFYIVSHWVIIVGGGWLIAAAFPELGSLGPWLAASGLIIVTGLFLWWRWHSRAWMKIDLFKTDTVTSRSNDHAAGLELADPSGQAQAGSSGDHRPLD